MKKGFTLIELVMVIVILGILAATALPRFMDLSGRANTSAVKGTLGGIRAAVAIWYASDAVTTPTNTNHYPSQLYATMFADGNIPQDPLTKKNTVAYGNATDGTITGAGGWVYNTVTTSPSYGQVWINSTAPDTSNGSVNFSTY